MSASRLGTCDMAAYMINCIYQIQSTLAVYEFTDKHIEMLAAQVFFTILELCEIVFVKLIHICWNDFSKIHLYYFTTENT